MGGGKRTCTLSLMAMQMGARMEGSAGDSLVRLQKHSGRNIGLSLFTGLLVYMFMFLAKWSVFSNIWMQPFR